jgi:transposase-like protein
MVKNMEYESYSLLEYQRRFSSQEACLEAISEYRWPRGFICPKCSHNDGHRLSKRRAIQCTLCRAQTSITAGTLFHKTKIPLTVWFLLIFLMSQDKGGISAVRAAELLDMHYTTVWNLMHKIREAMATKQDHELLSGFVEIDDAFFGGKTKGKPGRALNNKRQVVVMVERLSHGAGDAALVMLHNQSGMAAKQAVERYIEPMTHIRTDGYSSNSMLHGLGPLNMETIGRTYVEHGPLKNADRVISLAKRFLLGTYHQYCARAHLQRFLNEYRFRFNRRYRWCQLASRVLAACALCPPVPYAAIS